MHAKASIDSSFTSVGSSVQNEGIIEVAFFVDSNEHEQCG